MSRFLLLFLFSPIISLSQFLSNPSFEGPNAYSTPPPGWFPCGDYSSPDTQPTLVNGWNFTKAASDGNTYLSLITRGHAGSITDNLTEACGTQLIRSLKKDSCYSFNLDLSMFAGAQYDGIPYNNPAYLAIWLADSQCGKTKLLWNSPIISNEEWKTFSFNASLDDTYTYLILEAEYSNPNNKLFGNITIDNFQIKTQSNPISIHQEKVICEGSETELGLPFSVDKVTWWNGTSDNTVNISLGGIYWANLQKGSCSYIDTVIVKTIPLIKVNLGKDTTLCKGDYLIIDASSSIGKYSWSTGSIDPKITVNEPGTYSVTVQSTCSLATDEINVSYRNECCQLDVPNVFTPNGDGLNEVFEIRTESSLVSFHLVINNRWGKQVFETSEMKDFWDGKTMGGQEVSAGVYYWVADIKCSHFNEVLQKTMMGPVTIFK